MRAWIRKGSLEEFEKAQSNAYNYLHLDVTAFPLFSDDVEVEIKVIEDSER